MDELYQKSLLRLAANACGEGEISNPDAEETLDNPTCGDRITIQIRIENGVITELKHRNRSCMLCQASASMIAEEAIGKNHADILAARAGMSALLQGEADPEESGWPDFRHFQPVIAHPSRHNCVLLPFDTLLAALQNYIKKDQHAPVK